MARTKTPDKLEKEFGEKPERLANPKGTGGYEDPCHRSLGNYALHGNDHFDDFLSHNLKDWFYVKMPLILLGISTSDLM